MKWHHYPRLRWRFSADGRWGILRFNKRCWRLYYLLAGPFAIVPERSQTLDCRAWKRLRDAKSAAENGTAALLTGLDMPNVADFKELEALGWRWVDDGEGGCPSVYPPKAATDHARSTP